MKRIIRVTQSDIQNGIPCIDDLCPVAQALARCFPRSKISVTKERILINRKRVVVPNRVKEFLYHFDRVAAIKQKAKPFSFAINI